MSLGPVRLEPAFLDKVWGTTILAPWFPDSDRKIGEVWFPADEILVKFIFTSERLSVQVHPNDEQAREAGEPRGKTEMWHILRAAPGASIALGFREPVSPERIRDSALSGEIVNLLDWKPVAAGDSYFNPPGTVHALGGGLALVEIQENSDNTYRLYDYRRPRDLHLERAVRVSSGEQHPGKSEPVQLDDWRQLLADCDYFVTELMTVELPVEYESDARGDDLLVTIDGRGTIDGQPFSPGQVWRVPAAGAAFAIRPDGVARLLRTYLPRR